MSELGAVVEQLREKRNSLLLEVKQLDQAINALSKLGGRGQPSGRSSRGVKRTMSAAARARIAAAQRARWAKVRAAKRKAA